MKSYSANNKKKRNKKTDFMLRVFTEVLN